MSPYACMYKATEPDILENWYVKCLINVNTEMYNKNCENRSHKRFI